MRLAVRLLRIALLSIPAYIVQEYESTVLGRVIGLNVAPPLSYNRRCVVRRLAGVLLARYGYDILVKHIDQRGNDTSAMQWLRVIRRYFPVIFANLIIRLCL